jgi:aminoglycoside 2'-N-acetyltransferase I
VKTDDLGPALRAEIVQVCIAAHADDNFANLFAYFPTGGRHFLAYLGDRMIGHAVVTTRWLQPEGQRVLRTAYVDAVAIAPDAQRLGHGTHLMKYLATEIPDYEVACLGTDRPGVHGRIGWELWRGPFAGRDETGLIPTPTQTGIMILRLPRTPELELDSGLSIERQIGRVW